MRLGKTVLLEIMAIVQGGILEGQDISTALRDLDLDVVGPEESDDEDRLELSQQYLKAHPRQEEWN